MLAAFAAYKLLPLDWFSGGWRRTGRRHALDVRAALLDPRLDLDPLEDALHAAIDELQAVAAAPVDPIDDAAIAARGRAREVVQQLTVTRAVLSLERGDVARARAALVDLSGSGLGLIAKARLALLDGKRPEHVPDSSDAKELAALHALLLADTEAQLALARGDHRLALRRGVAVLASTRLRALALARRDEEARRMAKLFHPARLELVCKLHPTEPVARLLGGEDASGSPYR